MYWTLCTVSWCANYANSKTWWGSCKIYKNKCKRDVFFDII